MPFLYPIKQVPLLTSKHHYFIDTTDSVDRAYLDKLNAKASMFEDIGVLCIGIFTNRTDISPGEIAYHFGKKNRIKKSGEKRDNVITMCICLPKTKGRYPEDSIGFAIDNAMENKLDEDQIREFQETTFAPASKQIGFKRWQEGLLLLLDKTYLYLQNPHSPSYLYVLFTPSLLDRLIVIVGCLLGLFVCIGLLKKKI